MKKREKKGKRTTRNAEIKCRIKREREKKKKRITVKERSQGTPSPELPFLKM